ncbi:hypothetical protein SAMN06265222_11692 [Neorhodopirellula lusitana]|uniref:Protein kinase domain-containing protein n=1 Tax=Neorhodopirellula lusitana TaxID=445327 RepID=A0ABY1QKB7_9BACT|nr:serine/threonine-protein kinase [Neorhodopirellula lusitana]SMP73317.1 hypothetical protein SAMN06265222_11692 [Neorhodopirellula lusitana]
MNELDDTDDFRVVAAVKDYMHLLDAGNAPSQEEFLQQHAAIATELRPSLEGLALVHRAAEPKAQSMVAPDAEFTAKPIGDFQIVGELGRGGMGVVYEAIQLSLGRHVALKVLPFASGLDAVRLQRFRNEAHAAAALHHTNIVPVYAVGSDRGVHYYAMQMIDGSTLAELIENKREAELASNGSTARGASGYHKASGTKGASGAPRRSTASSRAAQHLNASGLDDTDNVALPTRSRLNDTFRSGTSQDKLRYFQSVVRMTCQAAIAIEHAHQYGVIHRDIKPANLLLDSAGKIWVTDFGLAQVQNGASELTRTGDPMGTLRYMSPEQASGRRDQLDHRTDIYSLGVTLYELLTLRPAIEGEGYREMLNSVALHDPPTPKSVEPALPIELDTIIRKAIAKLPQERYSSAGALADDLQAWLDDKPIAAKPPTVWERLAKWRRRNSGWVAAASAMLLLATLGLLVTTLMIWREQRHTANALSRETEQRLAAQESFQQARNAVDAFSSLSESELAYRPDLQDLRRSFLETSLSFYQDFLAKRANAPQLTSELKATSDRVQRMVNELQVLENLSPLLQLSERWVQADLKIDPEEAAKIEDTIYAFEAERESFENQFIGGMTTDNQELSTLLREFDQSLRQKLSESQLTRLHQIARQRRLPFTFKTTEIVTALSLSREQRDDISRIIEENRPKRGGDRRGDGRGGDGREGPGKGGPPRFGGPGWRPNNSEFGPGSRTDGPPGSRTNGPPNGPQGIAERSGPERNGPERNTRPDNHGPNPPGPSFDEVSKKTVQEILAVLTDSQRETWDSLVGPPIAPR